MKKVLLTLLLVCLFSAILYCAGIFARCWTTKGTVIGRQYCPELDQRYTTESYR